MNYLHLMNLLMDFVLGSQNLKALQNLKNGNKFMILLSLNIKQKQLIFFQIKLLIDLPACQSYPQCILPDFIEKFKSNLTK